jgi:HTH-type transcriptional regulator/antitoxin HigA
MDIRPIKNAEDLAWGLREIEKGMSGPVRPGSPQGDRLEVIMTLVHAYEKAQHPMPRVDPIEAIRFRMEQEGLTTADLLAEFGTRGRASEILQKKRRLSLGIMRALNKRLGIPLDVLARDYALKTTAARPRRVPKSARKTTRKASSPGPRSRKPVRPRRRSATRVA